MFHAFSGMGGEIFIPLTLPYLSLPYVIIPFILIEAVFIPTIAKRRNYKDKSRHNCCLGKRIFNGHGNTCFNSTSLHFAVCHFFPINASVLPSYRRMQSNETFITNKVFALGIVENYREDYLTWFYQGILYYILLVLLEYGIFQRELPGIDKKRLLKISFIINTITYLIWLITICIWAAVS